MNRSVERQVQRSLWAVFFYRGIGDLVALPRMLLNSAAVWILACERTLMYLELDAARRYRALTGVDLAVAVGEDSRYAGLSRSIADQRDETIRRANEPAE